MKRMANVSNLPFLLCLTCHCSPDVWLDYSGKYIHAVGAR